MFVSLVLASLVSTTPAIRPQHWWKAAYDVKRASAATNLDAKVAFVGDSITARWGMKEGAAAWQAHFATGKYKAVGLGISGDRTEHVLWRLMNDQLGGLQPKAFVLMIGTNNNGHRPAEEETPIDTIRGVRRVVEYMRCHWPETKIVLHPIFPRGATTNDACRVRNERVNAEIKYLADGTRVFWCDFNAKLVTPEGVLEKTMAPDLLHPREPGYEIWAEALKPYLDYALGLSAKVPPRRPAKLMPTALPKTGPRTTIPKIKKYWLDNPNKKEEPRIRNKRAEQCANVARYYDAIWLGDSITHFWEHKGNVEVFRQKFGAYKILNAGFGGDQTQNLLWNIRHGGILDGVHTRLITLMIGTNNAWGDTAEDIAAGIAECLKTIRAKQPQAKVLLMPLLPREVAHKRGERDFRREGRACDELMPKHQKVNELIRPLADGEHVLWCDLTGKFTDGEGLPDITLLGDGTHPNADGYTVWADAVLPLYRQILGH